MRRKQSALLELQKILEDGYEVQAQQNAFKIQRVPQSGEPGHNSKSFQHYLEQGGSGASPYWDYTASIKTAFEKFGLSFSRFRSRTESINPTVDSDSPAALFATQLKELDKIVNDDSDFQAYILPATYAEVTFDDGVISQGYQQHKFKGDLHRDLLYMLWDYRRIVNSEGKVLRVEKPVAKGKIQKNLKISHERFKDIVRAIKIEMKRKDIQLDIKFPKDVFIVVTQDSM